jgi:hypothetical protein
LSISIGERTLWIAELSQNNGGPPRGRVVEFVYPDACSLEDTTLLGAELATFLATHGFSARRVVFGVPAKWLIVRPYDMPPADEETAANILWLHASERVMPALGPMVFDYLGDSLPNDPTSLLLIGLQQRRMEQIMALARAAKLKPIGITPIGAAVGSAASQHVQNSLIALFGPGGLELIDQDGPQTRSIHFVRANGSAQPVLAELRRRSASFSMDNLPANGTPRNLVLWDDTGMAPDYLDALRKGTALPITDASRQWLNVSEAATQTGSKGLSALALGLSSRATERLNVDFLNPRIAPPEPQRANRVPWLPWAIAVAALLAIAAIVDLSNIQKQISGYDDRLQSIQPAVDVARPYVASMQFAETFRTAHPRYLSCLADLTQALPPDGKTFLTNFNLHADMTGEISGTSDSEQNVLNFRDKLNSTGRFADLDCKLSAKEAHGGQPGNGAPPGGPPGGGDNSASFSLTFVYTPK